MGELDSATSDLRQFAESFFVSLGSQVSRDGNSLIVAKIPAEFESAYGKQGPYKILFDKSSNSSDSSESGELLSRGSFLLKTMTSYLEQRGQTALIKLIFEEDYLSAFKRSFSFKRCELSSLSKKPDYKPIYLFSFSTTLQYLNEKEQVMNSIAVRDNQVIPFSLEQYKYEQGNPKDLSTSDVKSAYAFAKESLKSLVSSRVEEVSNILSEKTTRETDRIKEHYNHQLAERTKIIDRVKEQIATIDKSIQANPTQSNSNLAQRREKLVENLKILEDPEFESKLVKEREFFVRDEEFKHSLNISNKLVSTTLVYYPIFTFTLVLKNKDVTRNVEIVYNPMKNDFQSPITCEHCKRSIQEIFLCSSAHVLCGNCFDTCRSCERGICSLCMKKTCSQCARKLCKRCVARCTFCWKDICKSHVKIDYSTGKEGCSSCLRTCSKCGSFASKSHLVRDIDGSEICLKCSKLSKVLVGN